MHLHDQNKNIKSQIEVISSQNIAEKACSSSSSSSFSLSDFMDGFPNVGCSHLQVLPWAV